MSLAIFDLDNTLLAGDSDYLWGRFLIEHGLVDGAAYERENLQFYEQYREGTLDIYEFLAFQLAPLAAHERCTLEAWRARFLAEKIDPIVLPAGLELIQTHRRRGDTPVIITATNRFITAPIADRFGVAELIATEPEVRDGEFTGHVAGTPCFQDGKVERLAAWLRERDGDLTDSWFYSDSHNDLPLLERVTHPVAVDPDDTLARQARTRGWRIISLRSPAGAP
ncbi:MAG: HAD family hydrolase [Gammaproteobacteria bacterium]|nr:HAD family hydrolase [Gammaproteobacteria bacterium]